MFEEYRVNEKKDVTPPKIVKIKKKMLTKKDVLECKVELMYSSGLNSDGAIIFLGKVLDGKRKGEIIPITENNIV